MAGFDWGKISKVISNTFDTDLMDIGRRIEITNPDGSTGELDPTEPIYENVPCFINFNSLDNATSSVDTSPIIISMTIYCQLYVDLKNNDYVYAKKCDAEGNVLEIYSGVVGFHTVEQSRQSVQLAMQKDK